MLPPFWSLVEAHGGELLAYARRLVGREAEDVLQESFLRALRSYPKLSNADHLRAWLFRIVTTTAMDHSRVGARRREVLTGNTPDLATEVATNDGFDALMSVLPEEQRKALVMRYGDDLAYQTIARRLRCSPEAARQRVSTAIRNLRRHLT